MKRKSKAAAVAPTPAVKKGSKKAAAKAPAKGKPAKKAAPARKPNKPAANAAPQHKPLSLRERLFVDAYVLDQNASKAALIAGYSKASAPVLGSRVLKKVNVRAAIEARIAELHSKYEVKQEEVLRSLHAIAFTDVNQLVEFRRQCCRFCWGSDFMYQLTPNEARQRDRIVEKQAEYDAAPTEKDRPEMPEHWIDYGGSGFDRRKPPNADCPECFGEGEGITHIHDTRKLSPEARHLYAGVEETKDGLKVRTKSADKAIESLAKHKQLFVERLEIDFKHVPTEELDAIHERALATAAARQASVQGRAKRLGLTPDLRAADG